MREVYKWRWIVLSLFFWFIAISNIPKEFLDLGGDSAQYIILSESLCEGTGLRAINLPKSPFFYHYPPVFSLFLCPIIYFFGRNFYLMHILVALLGYLSLFFLYRIFKKYSGEKQAFFTIVFLVTNWIFISYSSRYILSDIPYLFCSSLTLLAASKYLEKDNFLNKYAFFTLFGLVLSYFTRYAGIALFLGVLAVLLLVPRKQKFKKFSFIFVSFLLVLFLWQFITQVLKPSSLPVYSRQFLRIDPYRPFLGTLFTQPKYLIIRLIEGVSYYYKVIGRSFFLYFMVRWNFLIVPLSLVSVILTSFGLWFKLRENKTCVFHYYFLIYFCLIVFWPYREGSRFILPILPFIYFYFFASLKKLLNFLPQKISFVTRYSLLVTLLSSNILSLPTKAFTYQNLPQHLKNFVSLHYWIKENLPAEGVIISRKPTITYLYTNHKAICYPYTLNPDQIWDEVLKNDVKYIIVEGKSKEVYYYLLPFLYKYIDELKLLHNIGKIGLYEVIQQDTLLGSR
ncbi:MAG: glycosyltransferase family 39 protein [Candidatus Omnitrophica bacterium]|nr:glycosyltransferase family 39 protein [Candidatus Omnitrophota bacterium]MBU1367047.1 glycosyltransferase family 39 protein [Candidatus Omnitrophota bacterium]MBU1523611.1 glycosyltransferase family 39 protein [Candidatus Omnitrophota bacterium]MBU1810991.1 glycosyltransferase family 39 protein [Candidatus Omnitrophota bacterium]MBU2436476.1 glycosyltransferase family 39 protein [Candidatus Omnitrophota bacterium]